MRDSNRRPPEPAFGEAGQLPKNCSLNLANHRAATADEVVLPNSDDAPAEPAQFTRNFAVTLAVTFDFVIPKFAVRFRPTVAAGAAVPETAIHKKRQPVPPKKKIRPAENILVPAPAGNVVTVEKPDQGEFGVLVATAANFRHHLRPFAPGKNIGH